MHQVKLFRATIKWFFIKPRFVKTYKDKKRLLVLFLLIMNSFIFWNVSMNLPKIEIKWENEPLVFENQAHASSIDESIVAVKVPVTIEEKVKAAFPEDANVAWAIVQCESQGDPNRIGDRNMSKPSIGLFQINQVYHNYTTEELGNADRNIAIARTLYEKSGWQPWSCYRFDFYKKYLK